jgi:spermidine/putrescine ABC transporter ATP-binding subunit
MHNIEFRNVAVHYQETVALRNLSLAVAPGEFLALLGPSGCGKTTLLRVLSGFVPYRGSVLFDGVPIDGLPAHRREIGIVFQDYALFPHKSVRENIGFGLRMRNLPPARIAERVDEMIRLLHLERLGDRYPGQLSGGQQQRVALARAIAIKPRVLLLDEPLGALDKKLREEMQVELRQLQRSVGITTIFVTHDQEEALSLADRIAVMNAGEIQQIGPTSEIYERPGNRFVAEFLGQSNLLSATIVEVQAGQCRCDIGGGSVLVARRGPEGGSVGDKVHLLLHSERIALSPWQPYGSSPIGDASLTGTVLHSTYLGGLIQTRVRLGSGEVFRISRQNRGADGAGAMNLAGIAVGDRVRLDFRVDDVVVLPDADAATINRYAPNPPDPAIARPVRRGTPDSETTARAR